MEQRRGPDGRVIGGAEGASAPNVPGYRVVSLLGQGGMGRVWRAVRASDGRQVALKVVTDRGDLAHLQQFERRFLREIAVSARLRHPNVVKALDGGRGPDGRTPFLVMELLRGRTLESVAALGSLGEDLGRRVLRQVAEGLAHCHGLGVVHRDVKPANIFLEASGRVVLLDFGCAFAIDQERLSRAGETVGTLVNMAPEQVGGGLTGPWTDVYQLGAALFIALTGLAPRRPTDLLASGDGHPLPPPVSLGFARPDLSPAFLRLVLRCLEVEPGKRFQDAVELLAALDAVEGRPRRGSRAERAPAPEPAPPQSHASRPLRVALLALLWFISAVAVGLAWRGPGAASDDPRTGSAELTPARRPSVELASVRRRTPRTRGGSSLCAGRAELDPGLGAKLAKLR